MFWAVLAGLAFIATAVGTGIKVGGALRSAQEQEEAKELEAQRLGEEALLLEEGKKVQRADIELKQKILSEQALDIAYEGRSVTSRLAARAGAGSLGGASPLRQAMAVQRKTETRLDISRQQSEFVSLAGEMGMKKTDFDIRWAELGVEQKEKEADWARQYGWLQATGYAFEGFGSMLGLAGDFKGKW